MDSEKFIELQDAIWDWQHANFGDGKPRQGFMGMMEEAGEFCHSALKMVQGIRGTTEKHRADMEDAIGDIFIYLLDFRRRGVLGYCEFVSEMAIVEPRTTTPTDLEYEQQAYAIYKAVAAIGNVFEPCFRNVYHIHTVEAIRLQVPMENLFTVLMEAALLLETNLYQIILNTWHNVVSKRDWKKDPLKGQGTAIKILQYPEPLYIPTHDTLLP